MTAGSNAAARRARLESRTIGRECHRDYVQLGRSQREALGAVEGNCSDVRIIAVMWSSGGGRQTQWKSSQAAARQLNLQLHSMEIRSAEDLENAFNEAVKARAGQ